MILLRNFRTELRVFCSDTLPLVCRLSAFVQEKVAPWLGWLPKVCRNRSASGFTLAELLITLAILGEIATFTIPKVLTAQQNGTNKARAKEAISMIAQAYQLAQLNGTVTTNTSPQDLAPYLNYVSVTTADIDDVQTGSTQNCTSWHQCIKLHSGAVLLLDGYGFDGSATTNAVVFYIDPDGVVTDGTTNGPGKSVAVFLYYSGRITTWGTMATGTVNAFPWPGGSAEPSYDPPWFSW